MGTLRIELVRVVIPTGLMLLFTWGIMLKPPVEGPLMIVANPFSGRPALELIAQSNGRLVAGGATKWIAVGTDAGDGLFRRAVAGHALMLLSPYGFQNCGGLAKRLRAP